MRRRRDVGHDAARQRLPPTSQSKKPKGWSGTRATPSIGDAPACTWIRDGRCAGGEQSHMLPQRSPAGSRAPRTRSKHATAEGAPLTAGPKYNDCRPCRGQRPAPDHDGSAAASTCARLRISDICIRSSMPPPYHAPDPTPRHGQWVPLPATFPRTPQARPNADVSRTSTSKDASSPENTQKRLPACFSGDDATLRPFCNVPRRLSRGGTGDSLG